MVPLSANACGKAAPETGSQLCHSTVGLPGPVLPPPCSSASHMLHRTCMCARCTGVRSCTPAHGVSRSLHVYRYTPSPLLGPAAPHEGMLEGREACASWALASEVRFRCINNHVRPGHCALCTDGGTSHIASCQTSNIHGLWSTVHGPWSTVTIDDAAWRLP